MKIDPISSSGPARTLADRLELLRQGDLINLGAASILGRGPSPTLHAAYPTMAPMADQPWSIMLVSELGWYVVLSQDCDIARSPDVEPCILVCPLEAVPQPDWQSLRSGPYSPREFPYPEQVRMNLRQWPTRVSLRAWRRQPFCLPCMSVQLLCQLLCACASANGSHEDSAEHPILTRSVATSFSRAVTG